MFKINTSPTREKFPLSENKIIKKTIGSILGLILFFGSISLFLIFPVLLYIFYLFSSNTINSSIEIFFNLIWLYPVIFLIFIVIIYLYQKAYFAYYYYDITNDYIVIKKGVFAQEEITIPWEKIQDVYIDQDIGDRIFGLYDVHLSTATITSTISAHIDGLEKQAAYELKTVILEKVKKQINQSQNENISI